MELPSKYLDKAVEEMASLPGIGKRTALRLVLGLLNQSKNEIFGFSRAFADLAEHLKKCQVCYNLSDHEVCNICQNSKRDRSIICVVQDIRDILAIENTQQFKGVYHVLGGVISPMDGVGPSDLTIKELEHRVKASDIKELILALSATLEGDTTNFLIHKRVAREGLTISAIARGIGVGSELEYTDEVTLGRSILNRTKMEFNIS